MESIEEKKSSGKFIKHKMIIKLFARNMSNMEPEAWLWLAVLYQAIIDFMSGTGKVRRDAFSYFTSGGHRYVCGFIGLNADWVLEIMRDYGGLYEREAA